jgi:hypothetical protein
LHTFTGKDANPSANPPKLADYNLPMNWAGHTTVGYVDNISMENVIVTGRQLTFSGTGYQQTATLSKSVIRGKALTSPTDAKYLIKNVKFKDVKVYSECITDANKGSHFTIDATTTESIVFNGCTNTALNDITSSEKYSVYPNPANDVIHIKGGQLTDKLTLINTLGQIEKQTVGEKIDLSELKEGIYLLKINNNQALKVFKK